MNAKFKFLVMAAAMAVGFASCSNEDQNGTDPDGVQNIKLRIEQPALTTYADEAEMGDAVVPEVRDGRAFFYDTASGIILDDRSFNVSDANEMKTASGKTFEDIPNKSTTVLIVANLTTNPITFPATTIGKNISTVKASLNDLNNFTDPVTNVTVQGTGAIVSNECTVDLYPAASRIAIKKVIGSDNTNSAMQVTLPMTEYKLEGIFINNVYVKLGLDYTTKSATSTIVTDLLNYGPDDELQFGSAYPTFFCDYDNTGIGKAASKPLAELIKEPENGVWAYNVFPQTIGTTINTKLQTAIPHVILKITGAKTSAPLLLDDPVYLTIKRFEFVGGSKDGTEMTSFEQGYAYIIEEIVFGGEHLNPKPEIDDKTSVVVKVTPKPWQKQIIKPIL